MGLSFITPETLILLSGTYTHRTRESPRKETKETIQRTCAEDWSGRRGRKGRRRRRRRKGFSSQ